MLFLSLFASLFSCAKPVCDRCLEFQYFVSEFDRIFWLECHFGFMCLIFDIISIDMYFNSKNFVKTLVLTWLNYASGTKNSPGLLGWVSVGKAMVFPISCLVSHIGHFRDPFESRVPRFGTRLGPPKTLIEGLEKRDVFRFWPFKFSSWWEYYFTPQDVKSLVYRSFLITEISVFS